MKLKTRAKLALMTLTDKVDKAAARMLGAEEPLTEKDRFDHFRNADEVSRYGFGIPAPINGMVPTRGEVWNPLAKYPRNANCFCQSGKKTKVCCFAKEGHVPKALPARAARMVLDQWPYLLSGEVQVTFDGNTFRMGPVKGNPDGETAPR